MGRLGWLRVGLIVLVFALALGVAAIGSLSFLTDAFVLRGRPIQTFPSPEGRWVVRVYEVKSGELGTSSWMATVQDSRSASQKQRVVWRGSESSFAWADAQVLTITRRSYLTQDEERVDMIAAVTLHAWEGRGPFGALFAFLPAAILIVGLPAAVVLPSYLLPGLDER